MGCRLGKPMEREMRDYRFMHNPDVFRVELGGNIGTVAYVPNMGCVDVCTNGHLPLQLEKEVEAWRVKHTQVPEKASQWPVRMLTILPTWNCNFHCSYCYAAAGRSQGGGMLNSAQVLGTLECLINEYKCDKLSLVFAGGGEPLIVWPMVRECIEGSQRIAQLSGTELHFGLVTNASLVTSKQADFLQRNKVNVTASWDILPDIQERQRGKAREVLKGIETLIDSGACVTVRATITYGNEGRQVEMVRELARMKFGISSVVFEPALPFDCRDIMFRRFVEGFLSGFKAARQLALAENLRLETGLLGRLICTDTHFCGAGWTLVPSGELSLCHRIAHPCEKLFDRFVFGRVKNDGGVVFDETLRRRLMTEDSIYNPRCRNCFARWNCGGGCRVRNQFLSESQRRFLCHLTRRELRTLIAERIIGARRRD